MSISSRDWADRAGASIGAGVGYGLAAVIDLDLSKFNLGGLNFDLDSTVGNWVVRGIVIGMCANAGRNAAVGVHDTVKYSFEAVKMTAEQTKKICSAARGWIKHCCGKNPNAAEAPALQEVVVREA